MAKDGLLVGFGMVSLWAISFIAVRSLTMPFWNSVEGFIGGAGNGNTGSGGGMS